MQYRPNCLWEAINPKRIALEECGWTQMKDLLKQILTMNL